METRRDIAVIGAGNGGLAVAGYVALRGFPVTVYDVREDALAPLRKQGGIRMTGKVEGLAPLTCAASPRPALEHAWLVILVVQGQDQGTAVRDLAPYLGDDQIVLVKPGGTGGALEVRAVLAESSVNAVVAETDAFLFACSTPEPGCSRISAIKGTFGVAALPAAETTRVTDAVAPIFPQARPAESVLHTGLANMNAVLHVAPMVANAGWIEASAGAFDFYGEGITTSVARAVEAYDAERLAVASALGIAVPTLAEWVERTYGIAETGLLSTVQALHQRVFGPSPAPKTLVHRYLTEDVPCGAVPVASLGAQVGVVTPLHHSLIRLASLLCQQDFELTGRTVSRLGLQGLTTDEIRRRVLSAC